MIYFDKIEGPEVLPEPTEISNNLGQNTQTLFIRHPNNYDDDDFKDTFKDTFKDATPAINRCKNDSDVPITTKSRPSTAPVTKPVRCSYVKTTDGLIPEAEAKAKLKQERSKLLIEQKRKRRADMAKKKEDDLAAKEKLSRNKKVSVAEVGEW